MDRVIIRRISSSRLITFVIFALLCHPFDCLAVDFPDLSTNTKHAFTDNKLLNSENDNQSSASGNVIFVGEQKSHQESRKTDLETAATGFGAGGYGGGVGFNAGTGDQIGFGGTRKLGGGNTFNSNYGGNLKNVKGTQHSFGTAFNTNLGNKGLNGLNAKSGHSSAKLGHINKTLKKGKFGSNGAFSKAAKKDGTVFGQNNVVIKAAKGTKFGQKGSHRKGHATKGFKNSHHKDEFSKNHVFHDENNVEDFFNKFGDEGAFKNDANGKHFLDGHHVNVFNKDHRENAGHYLTGLDNVANKGLQNNFAHKAHNNFNSNFLKKGGNNYAQGFNKGVHLNDQFGSQHGLGFGKKLGGFGGNGYHGGYGGGAGHGSSFGGY